MACILQVVTPLSASARGAPALSTQSRDVEAELQKLIQARQKDGQTAFSELKSRSGVSFSVGLVLLCHPSLLNIVIPLANNTSKMGVLRHTRALSLANKANLLSTL